MINFYIRATRIHREERQLFWRKLRIYVNELVETIELMYDGSINVEFSTKDRSPVHFEHFKSELKRNLSILKYHKRIKMIIDEVNDEFVKGKLKSNVKLIIEEVEKYINDLLGVSLITSSKKELSHKKNVYRAIVFLI